MTREIKFRAWATLSERMIEDPFHFELFHYSDENRVNQQTYRCYEGWRELEDGRSHDCILMQFTGLKDKNGKEIYEADVVRINDKIMLVAFDGGCYRTKYKTSNYRLYGWEDGIIEVIGNIYETTELTVNL